MRHLWTTIHNWVLLQNVFLKRLRSGASEGWNYAVLGMASRQSLISKPTTRPHTLAWALPHLRFRNPRWRNLWMLWGNRTAASKERRHLFDYTHP